ALVGHRSRGHASAPGAVEGRADQGCGAIEAVSGEEEIGIAQRYWGRRLTPPSTISTARAVHLCSPSPSPHARLNLLRESVGARGPPLHRSNPQPAIPCLRQEHPLQSISLPSRRWKRYRLSAAYCSSATRTRRTTRLLLGSRRN